MFWACFSVEVGLLQLHRFFICRWLKSCMLDRSALTACSDLWCQRYIMKFRCYVNSTLWGLLSCSYLVIFNQCFGVPAMMRCLTYAHSLLLSVKSHYSFFLVNLISKWVSENAIWFDVWMILMSRETWVVFRWFAKSIFFAFPIWMD